MTPTRPPIEQITPPLRTETTRRGNDRGGSAVDLFVRTVGQLPTHRRTSPPRSFVFLHGLGGTQIYWTAAKGEAHLPPNSTLVDLFGFGHSPRPLTRYTIDAHLSALEPVLGRRAPSVLVGHSLGAALALAYAARHPDEVDALVLISLPAYGGLDGAVRWLRRRPRGWFLTNMALAAATCLVTRRILGPILPMLVRNVPREVARDLVEHNLMSSTTSLWNVLYRRDPAVDLDVLPEDLPVVFIHGTDDATAPIDSIRRLAREHRGRRLVEFAGVDHHPWLRRPEECAEAIAAVGGIGRHNATNIGSSRRTLAASSVI